MRKTPGSLRPRRSLDPVRAPLLAAGRAGRQRATTCFPLICDIFKALSPLLLSFGVSRHWTEGSDCPVRFLVRAVHFCFSWASSHCFHEWQAFLPCVGLSRIFWSVACLKAFVHCVKRTAPLLPVSGPLMRSSARRGRFQLCHAGSLPHRLTLWPVFSLLLSNASANHAGSAAVP